MYIVKRFEQVVDLENRYIKTDYYYYYTCIKFESSSSPSSYLTRVHKVPFIKRDRQTDGQTDRRTDGRTSSTLYPLVFTGDKHKTGPHLLSIPDAEHKLVTGVAVEEMQFQVLRRCASEMHFVLEVYAKRK